MSLSPAYKKGVIFLIITIIYVDIHKKLPCIANYDPLQFIGKKPVNGKVTTFVMVCLNNIYGLLYIQREPGGSVVIPLYFRLTLLTS
jgi:hypothetical protein